MGLNSRPSIPIRGTEEDNPVKMELSLPPPVGCELTRDWVLFIELTSWAQFREMGRRLSGLRLPEVVVVVKSPYYQCRGLRFHPWSGN